MFLKIKLFTKKFLSTLSTILFEDDREDYTYEKYKKFEKKYKDSRKYYKTEG